jgi:ferredoxin
VSSLKVVVDFDLCEANALCARLAPEVFKVDDDDMLHVLVEQPSDEQMDKVRKAVKRCPRGAIKLEE